MKQITTAIEIDASRSAVWEVLTDLPSHAEWNPFIRKISGDVTEGGRLIVEITPPGGKAMVFKPTVTVVAPDSEFRWLGRLLIPGIFDGEHIFTLESLPSGGTRFVQREEFRGLLVPMLWSSMAARTEAGFQAMNAALRDRVLA